MTLFQPLLKDWSSCQPLSQRDPFVWESGGDPGFMQVPESAGGYFLLFGVSYWVILYPVPKPSVLTTKKPVLRPCIRAFPGRVFKGQNLFHGFGPRWLSRVSYDACEEGVHWCQYAGTAQTPRLQSSSSLHCVLYLAVLLRLLPPLLSPQGPPHPPETLEEWSFSSVAPGLQLFSISKTKGTLSESLGAVL